MLAATAFPSPSAFTQGSSSYSSAPSSPESVEGARFNVPVDLSDPDQDHDTSADDPNYRPFHVPGMPEIRRHKYSTSLDVRGFIPVYEYMIGEFPVMWDRHNGVCYGVISCLELILTNVNFQFRFRPFHRHLESPLQSKNWHCSSRRLQSKPQRDKDQRWILKDSRHMVSIDVFSLLHLPVLPHWQLPFRIPYESARALCRQNAYSIRHYLRPLFGPDFAEECIPPDHPHFGSLLLDPSSGGSTRVSAARRVSKTVKPRRKSSLSPRRSSRSTPYPERSDSCSSRRPSRQERSSSSCSSSPSSSGRPSRQKTDRVASRMALSRFLNCDSSRSRSRSVESMETDNDDEDDDLSAVVESPTTTPSPTYPKAFVPYVISDSGPQLPPLRTPSDQALPRVLPAYVPVYLGGPDQLVPVSHDTLDAVRAASVLLRLSQDSGEKPYRPLQPLPNRVVHDDRAFWICWDH